MGENGIQLRLIGRYTRDKLLDRSTYHLAFVVGTIINLYGHILVPMFRGVPQPFGDFVAELKQAPVMMTISLAVGYLFPFLVGLYAAVATRYGARHYELKAQFPDTKPDPVFRAAPDGHLLDAGDRTLEFFDKYSFYSAQAVLGTQLWERIQALNASGEELPVDTKVDIPVCEASFLVSFSPAGDDGAVNVYLTKTSGDT